MSDRNPFIRRHNRFYENLDDPVPCLINYSRNRLYLSDTVRPGMLLITPDERVMYSSRAHEMAESEASVDEFIAVDGTGKALELIDQRLGNTSKLGLERRTIPATMDGRIRNSLGIEQAIDVSGALRDTRIKKDERELDYLREAASQSDRAHRRAREVLNPGMEELELASEVEGAARKAGHEGIMTHGRFDAYLPYGLIASGENLSKMGSYAYVSHGSGPTRAFPVSAGHRVIEDNDPVVVDIGGVHYGYNADVSRTYIAGDQPDARLSDAYQALTNVYDRMEGELVAGARAGDIYRCADDAAKETEFYEWFQGYEDKKGPFVGHGIGLEIDEPPVLSPGNDRRIPEGAVVTIEIFIVFPNDGGVKIEESCRVRSNQPPEILSGVSRKLVTLGT